VAERSPRWPRRVRRVVQALAFLLFLAYVARAPALAGSRWRGDWLMRFSAYSGVGASVSAWRVLTAFWPAAALLAAAVLLGRYFCGWLCPLGATLDASDRIIAWLVGRRPAGSGSRSEGDAAPPFEHVRGRRFKYYVLAASLVAAFAGVSWFGLFDPLSIAARSFVIGVHSGLARGLAALFEAPGWSAGASGVRRALVVGSEPVGRLHAATLVVLLGILALGLVRRRFWCRYLCPLGAMHALASKAAVTHRAVSDACIECGRCAEACPMGCISPDGKSTLGDECILCLQCQPVCPTDAVRFFKTAPREQCREVDLTRRGALAAVVAGAVSYPLLRLRPAWAHAKGDPLIRPPLAGRDPDEFLSRCLRCGQCIRVCPNQVIQPAGLEAGLESLWTPRLSPRPGYCEYNCNLCGRACPSGAIPPFTLPQKHAAAMGLAYLDRVRCIPWRGYERRDEPGFVADRHNCGVCEEVCPVPGKAIHFRRVEIGGQELRMPYVRAEACVGCGYCEAVCPLAGEAAVRVTGGFRQLPAPESPGVAAPRTETALPAQAGELRLSGPKRTYEGPDELFDYINGAGEAYLDLNFVRVTAAEYVAGDSKLKADLWQFETTEDAFGAFAMDRRGRAVDLGDEAAVQGGSLWARRGHFTISLLDRTNTPPEQTRRLAEAVLAALDEAPARRPAICRRLPSDGLDPATVAFMRNPKPLYNYTLADGFIPDDVWGFTGAAVAAYGAYPALRSDGRTASLLLIHHGSAEASAAAADRLAEVRRGWGEEVAAAEPLAVLKAGPDDYCVVGSRGPRFAVAFTMPSPDAGTALVRKALE